MTMSPETQTQKTLCRMCDDRCGIDVYMADGRIVDIKGNKDHIWNNGRLCAKARAAVDMVYHSERLLKPLKRTPDGWQEIPLTSYLPERAGLPPGSSPGRAWRKASSQIRYRPCSSKSIAPLSERTRYGPSVQRSTNERS